MSVSLIAGDIYRRVAEYIVTHSSESIHPYNNLFYKALSNAIPNAAELIYRAAQKTIEKTIEVKGSEPDVSVNTLVEWLSRYRFHGDDLDTTSALVFARLVLLESMLQGMAWVDQVGQGMVVIAVEGGSKYKLTRFGVLY